MTTDPKVRAYAADAGGCGHYRIIFPVTAAADQGYPVTLIHASEDPRAPGDAQIKFVAHDEFAVDAKGRTVRDARGMPIQRAVVDDILDGDPVLDVDVVILQRPMQRLLVDCIPVLQAAGLAVIVELDDDFHALSPSNRAWAAVHPSRNPERNINHLQRAMRTADLITVSTDALAARYGGHGRVKVLPNYVPAAYLDTVPAEVPEDDHVRVGWSGNVATHPHDLQEMGGAFTRLPPDALVRIIGDGGGVAERIGREPDEVTGWVSLADYPSALASLDVGAVPLERTAFNEAKSYLKGLEMAAVGVPFVSTPTAQYQHLHEQGMGWTAKRPRDWQHLLNRLVADRDVRRALADDGRRHARRFLYEDHAGEWADAWRLAADLGAKRRARSRVPIGT